MAHPFLILQAIKLFFDSLDGGDFPTSNDEYIGLLKYNAFEEPEPEQIESPTETLILDFDPVINKTQVNITNVYNQPTTINILSDDSINIPTSNLPIEESIEQSGQTATKITIGSPITLAASAATKDFGRFVYSPISPETKEIQRIVSSDFEESFKDAVLESTEKYLTSKVEGTPLDPLDSITYLLPSLLRGNRGEMTLVVGVCPLRILSQYYSATRVNAAIGILDEIPSKIEFTNKEISFTLGTENEENLKIDLNSDLQDIFGDYLNKEVDWYAELKKIAETQLDSVTKEAIATETDSLVGILLNSLAVYYNKLGLDNFPITAPETITQPLYDDEGNPLEPKTVDNHNFSEFLIWQFKIIDELFGRFPIDIQIEDSDLIKVGDQPVKIRLPNLAETLAELVGKSLFTEAKIDALLPIALKNLAESGSTRQQVIKNYYLAIAAQEYLGFKTKQKTTEVDLLFNPKIVDENEVEKTLAKALQNSKIPIKIEEIDDNNTLEAQMATVVEVARMMKARYWKSFSANGDLKEQIKKRFQDLSKIHKKTDNPDDYDFDFFIDCFEKGFETLVPGGTPEKPYGKPYKNRPKMKKYSTNAKSNPSTKPGQ
ncbi:hypothetical protein Xen7305DRAFT_00046580 [Xenococcus sp. PCC 7305]|uniref:hypothetical protein n=1 Tax=Xenococcus sp. PCC 7305 TaxID=102125 RepID=UPI0002AC0E73|nr:hypothetical protein [Xenococcus sp. PCC 7305]ELS04922.1 hypothetical protein Xen7305DRAFT_00046580 [Xenococcus sp. PCC 7305]